MTKADIMPSICTVFFPRGRSSFGSSIPPSTLEKSNEKYTFRTWLLRLGLIGDEFKTARLHLLKNLEGSIAWKDPAQALAQKERLAKKRLEEREGLVQYAPALPGEETPAQEQEAASGWEFTMTM